MANSIGRMRAAAMTPKRVVGGALPEREPMPMHASPVRGTASLGSPRREQLVLARDALYTELLAAQVLSVPDGGAVL
jgi:hypothetical protein